MALIAGDALALPFPDHTFDAVTISFGLRNIVDTAGALREMARVTRPGGRLVELDVRGFPIRRDWHIVHLRRRRLPASVLAFIDFLKDTTWLSRNGTPGRLRPPTD